MRTVLIIILVSVLFIGAGYFGLPILIEKETGGLKSDVQDLKQRLQKIEAESKAAPLKPDADIRKVIKTVNDMFQKEVSLEDSFKKSRSALVEDMKKQAKTTEETFKKQVETIEKQKAATKDGLKKQAEIIEKANKERQEEIRKITFDTAVVNIKGHILKARVELVAKNVGTAKTELDLINDLFSKVEATASDEDKKAIKELQSSLKRAREEIDIDLPSTLNRIDLLWHQMDKLLKKV